MIGLVVVVLSLIAAPQFALSATPLSFVKLHPDGLGLLAASDPNKVAAADLENLHDEEEEGEDEGGKDTRSSMFRSFSPFEPQCSVPFLHFPAHVWLGASAGGALSAPSPSKAKPRSIDCNVKATKYLSRLDKLQNVTVKCKSSCALNIGEADDGWQVPTCSVPPLGRHLRARACHALPPGVRLRSVPRRLVRLQGGLLRGGHRRRRRSRDADVWWASVESKGRQSCARRCPFVYQLKGDAAGSSMHLKEKHSSAVVSFVHPKFLESRNKLPQTAWRLLLNLVYLSYEGFVVCGIVVYALPISSLFF